MRRYAAGLLALLLLLTGCQSSPARMQPTQSTPPASSVAAAAPQVDSCRMQVRDGLYNGFVMAGTALSLVVEFPARPDQGAVQQSLLAQLHPQGAAAPVSGVIRLHWETETDLLLTIAQIEPGPSPWLQLALDKPAVCKSPQLLIGTPTTIWRWNFTLPGPVDRLPVRLGDPVRVLSTAQDRPEVLVGVPMPPGPPGSPAYRYEVVDLNNAGRQQIGAGNWQTTWSKDGRLWLADPTGGLIHWKEGVLSVLQTGISSYISPDGKTVAIFQAPHPEADPAGDRTVDLTLVNLESGKTRTLRQVAHFVAGAWLAPGADPHPRVRANWSSDSRMLAVEDYPTAQSVSENKPQGWVINLESTRRTQVGGLVTFSPDDESMFLPGRGLVDWQGELAVPLAASAVMWSPSGKYLWVPGAGVVGLQGELIWRLDEPGAQVRWLPGDRVWWEGHGLFNREGERLAGSHGSLLAAAADGKTLLTKDMGLVVVNGPGGVPQGDSSRPVWGLFGPGDSPLIYATADGRLVARRYDGKQFSPLAETTMPDELDQLQKALFAGQQLLLVTGGPGTR